MRPGPSWVPPPQKGLLRPSRGGSYVHGGAKQTWVRPLGAPFTATQGHPHGPPPQLTL